MNGIGQSAEKLLAGEIPDGARVRIDEGDDGLLFEVDAGLRADRREPQAA